jgi:hypothetical protein
MKEKPTSKPSLFRKSVIRATRAVYLFVAFYMISIILFDSGNLIVRESIIDRWTFATILLVTNTLVWFGASQKWSNKTLEKLPLVMLSGVLIIFAGYSTYWERGMASTSTIFYTLPILLVALVRNRHAIIASAITSAGVYAYASVKYFNDFFNEGYRIQLWSSILLIVASISTITWIVLILVGLHRDSQ